MADLRDFIFAEKENVERTLNSLDRVLSYTQKNEDNLAAMATYLHNFYNCIENIMKKAILEFGRTVPKSDSWHKDLVDVAELVGVISDNTKRQLKDYLAFRHFFIHSYSFMLEEQRLTQLAQNARSLWNEFYHELNSAFSLE